MRIAACESETDDAKNGVNWALTGRTVTLESEEIWRKMPLRGKRSRVFLHG
jgi:hypothetical protein